MRESEVTYSSALGDVEFTMAFSSQVLSVANNVVTLLSMSEEA